MLFGRPPTRVWGWWPIGSVIFKSFWPTGPPKRVFGGGRPVCGDNGGDGGGGDGGGDGNDDFQ